MEKDLFYSPDEKIAFLITGYDEPANVQALLSTLENGVKRFDRAVGIVTDLKTRVILKSSRYKYMRVYWHDNIDEAPEGAFVVGGGEHKWTMDQWLSN